MVSKRIFNIGVVLCCVVLFQFILIICLVNQEPKVIIEEVEVVKELEIIKEVPIEVQVEVEVEPTYAYNITSEEREMLARLVYLESNIESLECQKAIISVVINRWQSGYWGNTLKDVIYADGQFTPAYKIYKTTPNETNYEAVDAVLKDGVTLPDYVMYFRANYHFTWASYKPYTVIDQTYFGYVERNN